MKIAVPAGGPTLDARVEQRLSTAPYLLVIETGDLSFDVLEGVPPSHGPGAGIQAVSLVLGMGAKALLTGYISPDIAAVLRQNGIEVINPVRGSVWDAVEKYKRGAFSRDEDFRKQPTGGDAHRAGPHWRDALRKASKQFSGMVPVLIGVILLVGLFSAFFPKSFLLGLFSGDMYQDSFIGACVGSVLTGNPVNSYVIGETLLTTGVSLFGVTAMMLSWVSVWLVQLPAEMTALGVRFSVIRNLSTFLTAIPAAMVIVWLSGGGP